MHRSYEKFEDTKAAIRRAVYRRIDKKPNGQNKKDKQ